MPYGTKLFDETGDLLNPKKANSYIYNAFLCKEVNIDESLSQNVSYGRMSGLINYGMSKFDKVVSLNKALKFKPIGRYPLVPVKELSKTITKGTTPTTLGFQFVDIGINFVKIENISAKGDIVGELAHISAGCNDRLKRSQLQAGDILFSIAGSFGRISMVPKSILPANTNQALAIIRGLSDSIVPKYFIEVLRSCLVSPQIEKFAKGIAQYNISLQELGNIIVPVPPLDVQQKIVAEIEALERREDKERANIQGLKQKIESFFEGHLAGSTKQHLGQIGEFNPSKAELTSVTGDTIISFVEMASVSNDGRIINAVDRSLSEVRKGSYTYFKEDDIIIAKITPCMENGKCALATNLTNSIGMGSSEFHVLRCDSKVLPPFLFGYLNRRVIREEAAKRMTGASGHRRVPILFYEQLSILLPPLERQQEIVDEIKKIESEITDQMVSLEEIQHQKSMVLDKYL